MTKISETTSFEGRMEQDDFSNHLRAAILRSRLSANELGRKAEVAPSQITRFLGGGALKTPAVDRIVRVLGLKLSPPEAAVAGSPPSDRHHLGPLNLDWERQQRLLEAQLRASEEIANQIKQLASKNQELLHLLRESNLAS